MAKFGANSKYFIAAAGLGVLLVVGLFYTQKRRPSQSAAATQSIPETLPAPPTEPERESLPTDAVEAPAAREYDIITLLPRDAIPAIDAPRFYSAEKAEAEYEPDELVLGVSINGEHRAYSTSFLDRHEIVNDTVGGRKIAVTW